MEVENAYPPQGSSQLQRPPVLVLVAAVVDELSRVERCPAAGAGVSCEERPKP
jgi:hypothetical protein